MGPRSTIVSVLVAAGLCCAAQETVVSGKVIDQDSLPLEGASIQLLRAGLSTPSGYDGSFRIAVPAPYYYYGVIDGAHATGDSHGKPVIRNGVLRFPALQGTATVKADLFDAFGRKACTVVDSKRMTGTSSVDISPWLAHLSRSSLYVLVVRIDRIDYTLKLLSAGRRIETPSPVRTDAAAAGIAKSLSSDTSGDTLLTARHGFTSKTIAVTHFADTALLISLASSTSNFRLKITGLTATYSAQSGRISLTWNAPSPAQFSYYEIYRATQPWGSGFPGLAAMVCTEERRSVSAVATSFSDQPGLDNSMYYYLIRPVMIAGSDTLHGAPSDIASTRVGNQISVQINHGDLFTATDRCSLSITDPTNAVDSVCFSQLTAEYLALAGKAPVQVNLDDPLNPPSDTMIGWLVNAGYLSRHNGVLAVGVNKYAVPLFGVDDAGNPIRAHKINGSATFGWTLLKGNGLKTVYAELHYHNGATDTLSDAISIAPYKITLNYANKTAQAGETMRIRIDDCGQQSYYFLKPRVEFNVLTGADTTFADSIDFWLCFSECVPLITYQITDSSRAWLETVPRHGSFTGAPAARDAMIFAYDLDTASSEGAADLSCLKRTTQSPQPNLAFKIRGDEMLNELCAPGSYWGPSPVCVQASTVGSLGGAAYKLGSCQTKVCGSASQQFQRIQFLYVLQRLQSGIKEFMLIARLKGKYFDDIRVAVATGAVTTGHDAPAMPRSYFDWFPPSATIDRSSPNFCTNGSIIQTPFSYSLMTTGSASYFPSVNDAGYSNITSVELVIAEKPVDMPWQLVAARPGISPRDVTADTLSEKFMYAQRHIVLPFTIPQPSSTLYNVEWLNIDPSLWPSGDYIMGIITEDELGNRGFAPIGDWVSSQYPFTNPWMVTVQSRY